MRSLLRLCTERQPTVLPPAVIGTKMAEIESLVHGRSLLIGRLPSGAQIEGSFPQMISPDFITASARDPSVRTMCGYRRISP